MYVTSSQALKMRQLETLPTNRVSGAPELKIWTTLKMEFQMTAQGHKYCSALERPLTSKNSEFSLSQIIRLILTFVIVSVQEQDGGIKLKLRRDTIFTDAEITKAPLNCCEPKKPDTLITLMTLCQRLLHRAGMTL